MSPYKSPSPWLADKVLCSPAPMAPSLWRPALHCPLYPVPQPTAALPDHAQLIYHSAAGSCSSTGQAFLTPLQQTLVHLSARQ